MTIPSTTYTQNQMKRKYTMPAMSKDQPEFLLRARFMNKTTKCVLPQRASLSDLRRKLSEEFLIPPDEVKVSTSVKDEPFSWNPVRAKGATLLHEIFRNRDQMLVEREQKIPLELQIIMRKIQKQEAEREARIRRWADEDGDFAIASFKDWKLNPGSWGFDVVNFLWPDAAEVDKNIQEYLRKRRKSRVMQKLPNEVMAEIKVFEMLEKKYKAATTVADILTCFFQLSASMNFQTCNGIAKEVSAFAGCKDFLDTLPENKQLLATFWNNVCKDPELQEKTYPNAISAQLVAEIVTEVCAVETGSELKISELAYALRKRFPEEAPTCSYEENTDKNVEKLDEWVKAILQWFLDHGLISGPLETSLFLFHFSPKCNLKLLPQDDNAEEEH